MGSGKCTCLKEDQIQLEGLDGCGWSFCLALPKRNISDSLSKSQEELLCSKANAVGLWDVGSILDHKRIQGMASGSPLLTSSRYFIFSSSDGSSGGIVLEWRMGWEAGRVFSAS